MRWPAATCPAARSWVGVGAIGVVLAGCGQEAEPQAAPARSAAFVVERSQAANRPAARGRFVTARVTRRAALRASAGGRVVARIGARTVGCMRAGVGDLRALMRTVPLGALVVVVA
jgi:hypothetical protein